MAQTIHLMTRGQDHDYTFLLHPPASTWWTTYNQKAPVTQFENPTCILERDPQRWRLYLSGIPSQRRDPSARVIRYTLVVEDDLQPPKGLTPEQILYLLERWLEDVALAQGRVPASSQLGTYLDQELKVEDLLQRLPPNTPLKDVLVKGVQSSSLSLATVRKLDGSWWGSLQNPQSRQAWLGRVEQLLREPTPGKAYVLNLISEEHAPSFITHRAEPQALLIRFGQWDPQLLQRQRGTFIQLNAMVLLGLLSVLVGVLVYLGTACS